MIELTEKQVQALQTSEKPPVLVNRQTQDTFVLLPTKEYERLIGDQADRNSGQKQHEYDDGPWTDAERDLLRAEAVDSLGWKGMEAYQE